MDWISKLSLILIKQVLSQIPNPFQHGTLSWEIYHSPFQRKGLMVRKERGYYNNIAPHCLAWATWCITYQHLGVVALAKRRTLVESPHKLTR